MEDKPHIFVRTFEQLILFPLDMFVLVAGLIFLIEKAWLFGVFLLSMALLFGIVGQALPHRKRQTTRQLYSQNASERFGNITHEEGRGLGKAMIQTGFLVGLVLGAAAHHRGLPWHWVLSNFFGSLFLFPPVAIAFCFVWSWIMEKLCGQPRKV
ncbi:MAG: hypothetical protein ACLPXB_01055 [Thiobacillaceae bacterium]